jgi:hypothetical protein
MNDIWELCQDDELRKKPKAYYTEAETARILGAPRIRVYNMRHSGLIKETRFGVRSVYIHRSEIERILRGELAPKK